MKALVAAVLMVLCGVSVAGCAPVAEAPAPTAAAGSPVPTVVPDAGEAPAPTLVEVPAIGVRARIVPLGLNGDGSLQVPEDFSQTGWWTGGPEPGEPGAAVIVGHVDSYRGPAVFFRLGELRRGDEILVHRRGGSRVSYVVDHVEQHPKDAFPTDAVYGHSDRVLLRLVTCGGDFDREARSYRDNLIVFAIARR